MNTRRFALAGSIIAGITVLSACKVDEERRAVLEENARRAEAERAAEMARAEADDPQQTAAEQEAEEARAALAEEVAAAERWATELSERETDYVFGGRIGELDRRLSQLRRFVGQLEGEERDDMDRTLAELERRRGELWLDQMGTDAGADVEIELGTQIGQLQSEVDAALTKARASIGTM
jgi:hypothetical protein